MKRSAIAGTQKNRRVSHEAGGVGAELRGGQRLGGGSEKYAVAIGQRSGLKREPLGQPRLDGRVLELDGLWTRTAAGRVEVKVIRDEKGVALGTFAGWEEAPVSGHGAGY